MVRAQVGKQVVSSVAKVRKGKWKGTEWFSDSLHTMNYVDVLHWDGLAKSHVYTKGSMIVLPLLYIWGCIILGLRVLGCYACGDNNASGDFPSNYCMCAKIEGNCGLPQTTPGEYSDYAKRQSGVTPKWTWQNPVFCFTWWLREVCTVVCLAFHPNSFCYFHLLRFLNLQIADHLFCSYDSRLEVPTMTWNCTIIMINSNSGYCRCSV